MDILEGFESPENINWIELKSEVVAITEGRTKDINQVDDVGLRAYSSKGFIEGDKELIQSAIDKHKPSAELKARTSGIVDSLNGKKINNLNDDALRLALFVVYDFLGWIDDNDKILIP